MNKVNYSDLRGTIYSINDSHPMYNEILTGWKNNMSNPNSKLIMERIQWSERNGRIPLLILGVKGTRIRYAAHGGSEEIKYIEVNDFLNQEGISLTSCKSNDDVSEWRKNTDITPMTVEDEEKIEKIVGGRPRKVKEEIDPDALRKPEVKKEKKKRISQKQIGDGELVTEGDEMWIEAPWQTCTKK